MHSVAWDPKSPHQLKLVYHLHASKDCCPLCCNDKDELSSIYLLRVLWLSGSKDPFLFGIIFYFFGFHS